jgi:hypothetical protein
MDAGMLRTIDREDPPMRSLVVTALALVALAAPVAATAKDGDVRVVKRCTGPSTVKLKLSEEDGRIEVEGEVDQNRVGVAWAWQLRVGGVLVARGTGRTRAPSGSFSVRRLVADRPAAEAVVVRAVRGRDLPRLGRVALSEADRPVGCRPAARVRGQVDRRALVRPASTVGLPALSRP